MAFTNFLEDKVMDHVFGSGTYTKPAALYLGLFTGAPGEAGGGTEVSGGSYARQSAAFTISGDNPTQAANTSAIEFPTATASWGTVTHVGVFDADTSGNLLAYAELTSSKNIDDGDVFRVPVTNLVITLE
jgi:hypothetical protein